MNNYYTVHFFLRFVLIILDFLAIFFWILLIIWILFTIRFCLHFEGREPWWLFLKFAILLRFAILFIFAILLLSFECCIHFNFCFDFCCLHLEFCSHFEYWSHLEYLEFCYYISSFNIDHFKVTFFTIYKLFTFCLCFQFAGLAQLTLFKQRQKTIWIYGWTRWTAKNRCTFTLQNPQTPIKHFWTNPDSISSPDVFQRWKIEV